MNLAFLFVAGILLFSSTLFVEEQRKQPVPQGALRLNLDGFLADNRDQNSGLKALLNNVQKQVISEKYQYLMWFLLLPKQKKTSVLKVLC